MNNDINQHVRFATVEAVIIRADGRREDVGIIAEYRGGKVAAAMRVVSTALRRLTSWV